MFGAVRSQVHVVDLATGECTQLTDGTEHAGTPVWSPDGTTIAFTRAVGEDSDLRFRIAVHLLDMTDPKALPRVLAFAEGVARTVSYSADGESLLVVGWSGDPVGHARLFRVPLDGGAPVDLTGSLDRNVMPGAPAYPGGLPQEGADGRILFCLRERGCTHLWSIAADGSDAVAVLDGAGRVVSGLSVARDLAVVALGTPTSYGELVVVDVAAAVETVVTEHGAAFADVEPFERVERTFTISDGTDVQAWLVRDPDHDPSARGRCPSWSTSTAARTTRGTPRPTKSTSTTRSSRRRGWAVLLVNPRGSDGYGEEFYDAVHGAWGLADANDFLEPIDQLVAEGLADPERLAVAGYSYGGFMACYLTGHDDRFAAAVAGGVVSDLVSMGGTCDDGHFLSAYELGGAPWQSPTRYAAMSPLTKVGDVRTPTLVVHGAADLTCPVGQAQQWHTALRELGVPTQLVLYPDASHVFILLGPPSQRLDFNRRVLDWVEQHAVRGGRAKIDATHWQHRLAALAKRHKVPGAQLGILRYAPGREDELVETAYGTLNLATGSPATTTSLFQIGSITKVWTATVVLQLVDEGLVELDTPVAEVVPELRLSDPDVTKSVTIRHLLTHTSGIDGDVFTDTGRGDDCLEKYVELLAEAAQNHPLGATWSYCNSGFSLLGRVIEKLTGTTWDQAMRDRLFTPLGLGRTVTLPEEALLHSAAVGHVDVDGEQVPSPTWGLLRSVGPAGLVTSTVADVLAFARLHMSGGLAADGTRVLSEKSAAAMTAHEADLPDKYILGDSWGLGWIRFGWDGQRLIGHDGNTFGQAAFLRILPEQGLAVALLTNGGHTRDLYEDLYREIFAELAGVEMPHPLRAARSRSKVDIAPYVGTYDRSSVRMEVLADGARRCAPRSLGPLAEMVPDPVEEYPLVPVGPGAVRGQAAGGRDLGAGDLLRAADRRALRALRRSRHTAGGLMDLSLVLADLRDLVECESPSADLAAVARSADVVARIGTARLGVAPEYVVVDGRTHLRWRLGTGPSRVLLLGHHDTVWPLGSLATHPWSLEGGVVRGPGCFDMLAGLAMAFHALAGS